MTKPKVYKSAVLGAVHETVTGMYEAGTIDITTLRRFDESCLTPIHEFNADEIKALRTREEVSQTVFARYLGLTKDTISQWERGVKRPAGAALKLLSLVERKGLSSIA